MNDDASAERQIVRKRQFLDADFFNGTAEELSARILALKNTLDADPTVDAEVSFEGEEDWHGICVSAVYSRLETAEETRKRVEEAEKRNKAREQAALASEAFDRARKAIYADMRSRGMA